VSSPVSYLSSAQLQRDLAIRDLSDPAEGPHAIQTLVGRAVDSLSSAWNCEVRWCRGPRIVPVADNYDRLGYLAAAISRETRYSRYVADGRMLRSHSTAMVPPALRRLAAEPADDVLLVCPGMVYRRDAIDWQHTGTPHQLDLWRVTRQTMTDRDMDEMIATLVGALTPGLPVTLLRSADPRVARQMLGLTGYQRVSVMPAITRDLSVAVPADDDEETLGDRVRDALGADANRVEEVSVLSATAYEKLPASAIARLGASPGQQNLLVRVVLRDLDTMFALKKLVQAVTAERAAPA
jgi:phenylalanyl-tRNA synthetase alpha chain